MKNKFVLIFFWTVCALGDPEASLYLDATYAGRAEGPFEHTVVAQGLTFYLEPETPALETYLATTSIPIGSHFRVIGTLGQAATKNGNVLTCKVRHFLPLEHFRDLKIKPSPEDIVYADRIQKQGGAAFHLGRGMANGYASYRRALENAGLVVLEIPASQHAGILYGLWVGPDPFDPAVLTILNREGNFKTEPLPNDPRARTRVPESGGPHEKSRFTSRP